MMPEVPFHACLLQIMQQRLSPDELNALALYVGIPHVDLAGDTHTGRASDLIVKVCQHRGSPDLLINALLYFRPDLRAALDECGGVPGGRITYLEVAEASLRPAPGPADLLRDPTRFYIPVMCSERPGAQLGADAREFVSNAFEKYRALLIIGDYGTGKSFLTQRLFLEQLTRLRDDPTAQVPVRLELRRMIGTHRESVLDQLMDQLHKHGYFAGRRPPGAKERAQVEQDIAAGKFLCILDGFDEIPLMALHSEPVEELGQLVAALAVGQNKVLITSRPGVLPGVLEPSFGSRIADLGLGYLLPWEPQHHWRLYLEQCRQLGMTSIDGFGDFVLAQPQLRTLVQTPLYCQMLVQSGDAIIGMENLNIASLYRLYINQYFINVSDRTMLRASLPQMQDQIRFKDRCLSATATRMVEGRKTRLTREEIGAGLTKVAHHYGHAIASQFVDQDTLVYSLLVMDSPMSYVFSHLSFYEFYAAWSVYQELTDDGDRFALLKKHLLTNEIVSFLADMVVSGSIQTIDFDAARNLRVLRRNLAALRYQLGEKLGELDLSGLDFQGYNFALRGRMNSLSGVVLKGANLQSATLARVDLHRGNLRGANLNRSVLDGANMRDADLSGATIFGISVKGTRFARANFDDVRGEASDRARLCAALWQEKADEPSEVDDGWLDGALKQLGCAS